jgi:predicted XRE-type DNA-binding protein
VNADAFRRWYESRSLTQTQVAGLLGIRQRRVSDMATGKSPVSRQTLRMIALCDSVVSAGIQDPREDILHLSQSLDEAEAFYAS